MKIMTDKSKLPKLTFEQRQEYEELLRLVVEDDEQLAIVIAEYILLKDQGEKR